MFGKHLTIAWRNLRKYTFSSSLNFIGLAVGMAGTLFIGSYVWQEWQYDRFFPEATRTYRLLSEVQGSNQTDRFASSSPPAGPTLAANFPEVESMVRIRVGDTHLVEKGQTRFYEENILYVDSTFFTVFPFPLTEGDGRTALARPNAIVITQAIAQKYFPETTALGKVLTLNETEPYYVSGVIAKDQAPSHLQFDFLLPFAQFERQVLDRDFNSDWGWVSFFTYLRLSPEADPATFTAQIPALLSQHASADVAQKLRFTLQPLPDIYLGEPYMGAEEIGQSNSSHYVNMLCLAGVLLLLISCINYTNIATAQANRRGLEMGIRKVLGARRRQLMQQHLIETGLLTGVAFLGALALLFGSGAWGIGSSTTSFLRTADWLTLVLLTAGVVLGTSLLAGIYPAYFMTRRKTSTALKGQSSGQRTGLTVRNVLVIGQFVASSALLIATLVIFHQLNFMQNLHLGFNQEAVVIVPMRSETERAAYPTLKAELMNQAEITAVSAARLGLDGGYGTVSFRAEAHGEELVRLRLYPIHFDFVETLQMQLLEGRSFSEDRIADADAGFIINEAAAKSLGWKPPYLGKRLEAMDYAPGDRRVIGVVRDFHYTPLHSEIAPIVMFYRPEGHHFMYVRTPPGQLTASLDALQSVWQNHLPDYPIDLQFLDARIDQQYRSEQQFAQLIWLFTGLTILVALLGLFGLTSFTIAQRTKEIGIRKVLGASVTNLVQLLARDFLRVVVIAWLLACPLAGYLMNHWLKNFAYHIELAWWMFALAGVVAITIALFIISLQSVKTALANPVEALRSE